MGRADDQQQKERTPVIALNIKKWMQGRRIHVRSKAWDGFLSRGQMGRNTGFFHEGTSYKQLARDWSSNAQPSNDRLTGIGYSA